MYGMDVLCQAKSGMGKTAVFVLATLNQLKTTETGVQVIVLCHARELAYQIGNEYNRFSKCVVPARGRQQGGRGSSRRHRVFVRHRASNPVAPLLLPCLVVNGGRGGAGTCPASSAPCCSAA